MKVDFQIAKSMFKPRMVKHIPSEKRVYRNVLGYTKTVKYGSQNEIMIKKSFLGIPLISKKKAIIYEDGCRAIDKWIELFDSKNMSFTYSSRLI